MTMPVRWVVLAVPVAVSLGCAAPACAADIHGVVSYTGTMADPKKVPVTIDQYVCGKDKDAEDLILGPKRGVLNAVVWLENPPASVKGEAAPARVEMDQKGCVFAPRVVLVPVGGTVDFLNSDRLLHNLHSLGQENPTFNRTQPRGRTISITFSKPEVIPITCDLHSWMRSWVVVAEHPFYALTNEAGAFTIANVPPGKYKLRTWQEALGTSSREVTVAPQGATVSIELKARQ